MQRVHGLMSWKLKMKLGILSIEINKYIDHFHHKIILAKRALELMDGLTGKC